VARKEKPGHLDTLVGARTVIEGNIESEGTVRVDGTLKGDLKAGGDAFVGPEAAIEGSIYANDVSLAGNVHGNILANGMLRLLARGRLYGNVQAHGLVTDEGGIFHGKCNIVEERSSQRERVPGDGEQTDKGLKNRSALKRVKEGEEMEAAQG
jgi:cytoskeletal protein CcmA (bactofilin family)